MGIDSIQHLELLVLNKDHPFWQKAIGFANNSSWSAGPFLANKMKANDFLEWERVVVAVINNEIVGYCTFTKDDELPVEHNISPFIGFVFVDEQYRGHRISEKMINAAITYAKTLGYQKVYLMSSEKGLYEKYGFIKIGDYKTIFKTIDQLFYKSI